MVEWSPDFYVLRIYRIGAEVEFLYFSNLSDQLVSSDFFIFNFIGAEQSQDFLIFLKHRMGAELGFFENVVLSARSGLRQNWIFEQIPTNSNVPTNSSWKCLVSNTKF